MLENDAVKNINDGKTDKSFNTSSFITSYMTLRMA